MSHPLHPYMQPPSSTLKHFSMEKKPSKVRGSLPGASPCFSAKLPAHAGVHGGHYSAKSSSKLCPFFPCPCVIFPGCWRVSPWPCWVPPQQLCSAALQKTSAIRGAHNITAAGGVPLPCWEGAKTFLKVCLCRNYPNHNERLFHLPLSPLHKKLMP